MWMRRARRRWRRRGSDAGACRRPRRRCCRRSLPPPPAPPTRRRPGAPPTRRQRVVIPMMNKSQADVAYGFTTITRRDPAYYAFWLMNNVFGQYALGGRLGDSIRERQGMAYYVSSTLDAKLAEGPLRTPPRSSPAHHTP